MLDGDSYLYCLLCANRRSLESLAGAAALAVAFTVALSGCQAPGTVSSGSDTTPPPTVQQAGTTKELLSPIADGLKKLSAPLAPLKPGGKQAGPHLGQIYSRSARFHDGRRNPVIVIPGILGSRLTDGETGRVLWGKAGLWVANPARSQDARLLALPIEPSKTLRQLTDHDIADAILGDVDVNLLGIPIQVSAYRGILSSLGVGGYRNDSGNQASLDAVSYGEDHYTCFEFHYDWRRDNSENAARLSEFIKEKGEYVRQVRRERFGVEEEPVRFNIVGHSMGGLVARYFLRYGDQPMPEDGSMPELNWAGAEHVEKLILVGTPNAGSAEGLQSLVDGIKYSALLPKYPAAVLGTMPSIYQLLPRPRHRIVVTEDTGETIDLYDWRQWQRYRWGLADPGEDRQLQKLLPSVETRAERASIALDHLQKSLARAKQFHNALDLPATPPDGTSLYLIAGDAKDTASMLTVRNSDGRLKVAEHAAGDETVLRFSALMDERADPHVVWQPSLVSPIHWNQVTFLFTNHLGLTSDAAFTDNVLYTLLEAPN